MKDNVHQVINRNEKLDETENLATSLGRSIYRKTYDPSKKNGGSKNSILFEFRTGSEHVRNNNEKSRKEILLGKYEI